MSYVLRAPLRLQLRLTARYFHPTTYRGEQFLNANEETFAEVISGAAAKNKVVLVDFYADWCNPCRMLSPILEKLAEDPSIKTGGGSSIDLVTVDTDRQVNLAQKYQVRSLPTVIAFKNAKPTEQFVGALNEAGVRQFLRKV